MLCITHFLVPDPLHSIAQESKLIQLSPVQDVKKDRQFYRPLFPQMNADIEDSDKGTNKGDEHSEEKTLFKKLIISKHNKPPTCRYVMNNNTAIEIGGCASCLVFLYFYVLDDKLYDGMHFKVPCLVSIVCGGPGKFTV